MSRSIFKTLSIIVISSFCMAPMCSERTPLPKRQVSVDKVWETGKGFSSPESAYFEPLTNSLFVSNIIGEANGLDGKGSISKISLDGKNIQSNWLVKGLNAPKGLRSYKGILWVTDIDSVHAISLKSARIVRTYKVKGAKFLNDIAVSSNGHLYISDLMTNTIYKYDGKSIKAWLKTTSAPNGLLVDGNELIMANWGVDMKSDFSTKVLGKVLAVNLKTKATREVTKQPFGNLDGIEKYKSGYLVSDWMAGKVFYVSNKGDVKQLLSGIDGAADIGYDPRSEILYVPSMKGNKLMAFSVR